MVEGNENKEFQTMEEALEDFGSEHFIGEPKRGLPLQVTVLEIHPTEILVEVGAKSEGIIPLEELVYPIARYKAGDKIDCIITYQNEEEGNIVLSERKRAYRKALETVSEAFKTQNTIKGVVQSKNRGGYTVRIFGVLDAFLPAGQAMFKREADNMGKELDFEILDYKPRRRGVPNIVISRRKLFETEIEEFFNQTVEGSLVTGKVESITDFGAFIEIGPVVGLIPKSEISYEKDVDIHQFLEVGKRIETKVLKISPKREKITLSLKALQNDPWENIEEKYPAGAMATGKVAKILPFGFVVRFEEGIEGLVHSSEVFWTKRRIDLRSIVEEGEEVEVEVLSANREKRKLNLSLKRVKGNPWENIVEKYVVNQVYDAKIVKILPNGLIAELEEGISGFVHITEISWNFLENIEESFTVGQPISVKILDINVEQQRIKLSLRKVQSDPWETAVRELKKGSPITGQVVKLTNTGAIVLLDAYHIEAFLPVSQISSERIEKPSDVLKVGDQLEAVVVRTVFEPEKERRSMVISVKQKAIDQERAELREYMQNQSSETTMEEKVKQKDRE
ncbi:MAG TPA: S1 RNA-binding domain-containing protein [Thermotogota bacterium]|jgi:small subunit ribosomal protein S1|nr:S1 RNA-binding domain-containing protein [Thermotogota bacterium]NLH20430.1 S1 RNA-binding domain-containing protein [Thermotogaceae bacterium]OQC32802.1 MAG: 30S ribosomal protein S1 [Thermotogota bacterium ADurb.Bin062]HNW46904.1 S1 RNA-binding domain-containing protein [Thermotogota bacterium]HNY82747.1 S1 RNA-binding domain-containing protein [Thermotogota bacterium]